MSLSFAETLRRMRTEKHLSQQQLAEQLFVDRTTIAKWESGSRMPDLNMLYRLADCLSVEPNKLLSLAAESDDAPNVILVDDEKLILRGALPVLEVALPNASIVGFTKPAEAIEYARLSRVSLAFLDIEMGSYSGLDLCRTLLEINPRTNVVFLTAYRDYSFDAWKTGACGYLMKPLTVQAVRDQLGILRYPFPVRREKSNE